MAQVFDGRKFVREHLVALRVKVIGLGPVRPKLASILASRDRASRLYVNIKAKAAQKIGAEVEIYKLTERKGITHLVRLIEYLNKDPQVHGVMIQLPLPDRLQRYQEKILGTITPTKDVDGLRTKSHFVHPTAQAVIKILEFARRQLKKRPQKVLVIGATGMVGRPLVEQLQKLNYQVTTANAKTKDLATLSRQAEILISTTGVPRLIKGPMVKKGAIVIDVGSPRGDVDFKTVASQAGFITPVPGGVGPVTVFCLLENLVAAAQSKHGRKHY